MALLLDTLHPRYRERSSELHLFSVDFHGFPWTSPIRQNEAAAEFPWISVDLEGLQKVSHARVSDRLAGVDSGCSYWLALCWVNPGWLILAVAGARRIRPDPTRIPRTNYHRSSVVA